MKIHKEHKEINIHSAVSGKASHTEMTLWNTSCIFQDKNTACINEIETEQESRIAAVDLPIS